MPAVTEDQAEAEFLEPLRATLINCSASLEEYFQAFCLMYPDDNIPLPPYRLGQRDGELFLERGFNTELADLLNQFHYYQKFIRESYGTALEMRRIARVALDITRKIAGREPFPDESINRWRAGSDFFLEITEAGELGPTLSGILQDQLQLEKVNHALAKVGGLQVGETPEPKSVDPVSEENVVIEQNPPQSAGNVFRRTGEFWEISFLGKKASLNHINGLSFIAWLLQNPHKQVTASELSGMNDCRPELGSQPEPDFEDGNKEATRQRDEDENDAHQKMIRDARAKLDGVMGELREAERTGNKEEQKRLEAIKTQTLKQLLEQKSNKILDPKGERDRTNVTHRIDAAIKKLGRDIPELKAFLEKHIETGRHVRYVPPDLNPPDWDF